MSGPHILIPTDFSDESRRVIAPASALAGGQGGRVTLLHVVPDLKAIPYGAALAPPQSDPELPEQVERARASLAELRRDLPADLDVAVEAITAERIGHAIAGFARTHGADYVAIASHGYGNLRRLLMGSVTRSVLSEADVPVIVYPRS